MRSSSLQAILVSYLVFLCGKHGLNDKYLILTSEAGLHMDTNNNLADDIMIYDPIIYADVPPKVNIEVDVMIDLENKSDDKYTQKKIEKLHRFGTEKVIWVLTATRQVIVALPDKPWLTHNWKEAIELLDSITFNIGIYLKNKGVQLPD